MQRITRYTETLNIEIETLQWALNEIAALIESLTLKEIQQKLKEIHSIRKGAMKIKCHCI